MKETLAQKCNRLAKKIPKSPVQELSIYEKSKAHWSNACRADLINQYQKLKPLLDKKRGSLKTTNNFFLYVIRNSGIESLSDNQLRELITNLESDLSINTNREWQKLVNQEKTKYVGRQKGRVHRIYH
ncbi:MAG: hypothetical protein NWE92_13105 [Candidatus Bathyarchaeota archaeon]|nr:hypothetical protein [Candidatus Bathyarchaeota archaeon]